MTATKAIFWDIDGTLLHSNGATREAKALTMQAMFGTTGGVRQHPFGGKTDLQILHECLESSGYTVEQLIPIMPEFEAAFGKMLRDIIDTFEVVALPNALELVQQFSQRADVVQGIITGNTRSTADIKLEAAGFNLNDFSIGAYGQESNDRNQLARLAVERAAEHAASPIVGDDVLIIGDTVADVLCARAVDAIAIAVRTGFEDAARLEGTQPDYLLDDLMQFPDEAI